MIWDVSVLDQKDLWPVAAQFINHKQALTALLILLRVLLYMWHDVLKVLTCQIEDITILGLKS